MASRSSSSIRRPAWPARRPAAAALAATLVLAAPSSFAAPAADGLASPSVAAFAAVVPPADIPGAGLPQAAPGGAVGGQAGAPVVLAQSTAQFAEQSMRIDRMEAEMRRLNGQIEELLFQIRQLQQQQQRAQEDMEFRLQEIEGNGRPQRRSDAAPQRAPSGGATGSTSPSSGPSGGDFAAAAPPAAAPEFRAEPGFGAPPADLGTLPGGGFGADDGGVFDGPLDLSAIARGGDFGGAGTTGAVGSADFGSAASDAGGLPGVSAPRTPPAGGGQDVATILAPSNPREAYDQSYSYILAGNYEMAEMGFRQFLRDHPDSDLAGNAHFWLGEAHFARKQFRDAADEFLETYKSYPGSQKAPESLLKLGLSLAGLGEPEAACATYAELVSKYPTAPRAVLGRVEAERAKASC